jgi:hypothetical protein
MRMAGMQSESEIKCPVEAVYDFFLDIEKTITRTDPTVESIVKITQGPVAAGTTFRIRQPVLGRMREQTMRFSALDLNRKIEMEAIFGPVRPRISLTFEPTSGGKRVTFQGESRPVGAFRLVPLLMNRIGQQNWDRRLRLTKSVLETGCS